MVNRQVIFAAYFDIFIKVVSVCKEVEGLDNGAIGGVFARNNSVVGFLFLNGGKCVGKGYFG